MIKALARKPSYGEGEFSARDIFLQKQKSTADKKKNDMRSPHLIDFKRTGLSLA